MNRRILGYKYDDISHKYIIDEEEIIVVKCIYDLFISYKLREDEIENLIKGIKSLHDIIEDKINNIWNKLYEKNENIITKYDVNNMVNMLDENKNAVVNILEQIKTGINQSRRKFDRELLEKIDDIIILIRDIDKISDKYGKFEKISTVYNQYLMDELEFAEHKGLISKEMWEEISSIQKGCKDLDITE